MVPKNKSPENLYRAFRSLTGKSQTEVSTKLGWSQSKLSRIEKQKVALKKADAVSLAEVLGVDASLLSGESDD